MTGTPTASEIDVRTLDVGPYPVDRHHYDQAGGAKGALLEGMRMSAAVVPTIRVDASLNVGQGGRVIVDSRDATAHLLAGVSRPALDRNKLVTGYVTAGADRADPPGADGPGPGATAVTTLVLRFPDATAAKQAATQLEDSDFGVAPDLNRKLTLPQYPSAYIHYRPGIASIGTFMAQKEFVISLFIQRPAADEADLLGWVRKTLDAQVPVLDRFEATPPDRLGALPVDPEGLLARTVVKDRSDRTPDPDRFAYYGAPAMIDISGDETTRQQLVDDTGLDGLAVADGSSVLRVRDAAAAGRLVDGLAASAGPEYDAAEAPNTVPGVKCLQLNARGDATHENRYRCYVPYHRFVQVISTDDAADVRYRVAAAYALLANNF
ncbi:hypothetical protein [Nocardia sp. alder85J]|uniref:DUF7373 family lipoprotein n=1 Tax=Nocardia sp. alder85J TaxID=2862949 RepID=UPI001CD6AAEB|nr:hypothetical protein [Nocardia sp. alder85J]MCX4096232.1 hypothetical protein [Nocardia sp. alder85J]